MVKVCNVCNCELNNFNAAKKDAVRFRSTCRSCYSVKRNQTRANKTQEEIKFFNELTDKEIVKFEKKHDIVVREKGKLKTGILESGKGFFSGIYDLVKQITDLKKLLRRKSAL